MSTTINTAQVPTGVQVYDTDPAVQGSGGQTDLGQEDFLRLMTAQLQNQDPLEPMDNSQFLGQMAQFSTVAGIEQMNATLNAAIGEMGQFRVATASTFLGQQVLVPGTTARPDDAGTIQGVVDLPNAVDSLTVTYTNAETGAVLAVQDYGTQPAGLVGFNWDEMPQDMVDQNTQVRISIEAETATGPATLTPSVFAEVMSVEMSPDSSDITLQIEDYGAMNSMEVTVLR